MTTDNPVLTPEALARLRELRTNYKGNAEAWLRFRERLDGFNRILDAPAAVERDLAQREPQRCLTCGECRCVLPSGPCSPCGDGDTAQEYHQHVPAPDVTLRDVLVLVRGIANVICLGLADQMDDDEATGRMLAIRDDADAMLRRKEV